LIWPLNRRIIAFSALTSKHNGQTAKTTSQIMSPKKFKIGRRCLELITKIAIRLLELLVES
jgi:hypothetical protein